jgi:glc operon protein GlcG
VVFAGGVPVRIGGEVVGAVGVSGGSSEQDRVIAQAGADVMGP